MESPIVHCNICGVDVDQNNATWKDHTDSKHALACGVCTSRFSSRRALENHITENHPEVYTAGDDYGYNRAADG